MNLFLTSWEVILLLDSRTSHLSLLCWWLSLSSILVFFVGKPLHVPCYSLFSQQREAWILLLDSSLISLSDRRQEVRETSFTYSSVFFSVFFSRNLLSLPVASFFLIHLFYSVFSMPTSKEWISKNHRRNITFTTAIISATVSISSLDSWP